MHKHLTALTSRIDLNFDFLIGSSGGSTAVQGCARALDRALLLFTAELDAAGLLATRSGITEDDILGRPFLRLVEVADVLDRAWEHHRLLRDSEGCCIWGKGEADDATLSITECILVALVVGQGRDLFRVVPVDEIRGVSTKTTEDEELTCSVDQVRIALSEHHRAREATCGHGVREVLAMRLCLWDCFNHLSLSCLCFTIKFKKNYFN